MTLMFLGKKLSKKHGCPVCGSRGKTEYKVSTVNTYYLPSGSVITARVGRPIEVDDKDGEFLLSLGGDFRECKGSWA